MNKFSVFILGAAAGAAITLFFTSERGKQIVQDLVDRYDDKIIQKV